MPDQQRIATHDILCGEAQQRADDIQVFRRELARLEQEDALHLSAEQREALQAHHARQLEECVHGMPPAISSTMVAMVAFACFVLDLAMPGQIFNVTPSDQALLPVARRHSAPCWPSAGGWSPGW